MQKMRKKLYAWLTIQLQTCPCLHAPSLLHGRHSFTFPTPNSTHFFHLLFHIYVHKSTYHNESRFARNAKIKHIYKMFLFRASNSKLINIYALIFLVWTPNWSRHFLYGWIDIIIEKNWKWVAVKNILDLWNKYSIYLFI